MKRMLILVEGQTEETFVRNLLAPSLTNLDIYLTPTIVATKRQKAGRTFKGGITSYARLRRDVRRLLGDTGAALVTTMLDYYGLPDDFPGTTTLHGNTPYERVAHLEHTFARDINHPKFLPFLTLHEFEALLFADYEKILSVFPGLRAPYRRAFQTEAARLPEPEEINEGRDTHPAKRIQRHIRSYRKTLHGPLIASRIGLPAIREKCPHFNAWLTKLENTR